MGILHLIAISIHGFFFLMFKIFIWKKHPLQRSVSQDKILWQIFTMPWSRLRGRVTVWFCERMSSVFHKIKPFISWAQIRWPWALNWAHLQYTMTHFFPSNYKMLLKMNPGPPYNLCHWFYSTLAKDAIGLLAKYMYGPFLLDPSDIGSGSTDGPSRLSRSGPKYPHIHKITGHESQVQCLCIRLVLHPGTWSWGQQWVGSSHVENHR